MSFGEPLRRYWPEMLLSLAVALPWLSLLALGVLWLWQGGHVWVYASAGSDLKVLLTRAGFSPHCRPAV